MDVTFEGNTSTGKDEWLTPPELIKKLGAFDLDPCSPVKRPWDTAKNHFNVKDDGLKQAWFGRVWCNPPYGRGVSDWLDKSVKHGNCVVLIFARTETSTFFEYVWGQADALLFIKGRLRFHRMNGVRTLSNAGAPSVLVAYGEDNAQVLEKCGVEGYFVRLKQVENLKTIKTNNEQRRDREI